MAAAGVRPAQPVSAAGLVAVAAGLQLEAQEQQAKALTEEQERAALVRLGAVAAAVLGAQEHLVLVLATAAGVLHLQLLAHLLLVLEVEVGEHTLRQPLVQVGLVAAVLGAAQVH